MDRDIYEHISYGKCISTYDMDILEKQCNQNLEALVTRRSCISAVINPADYQNVDNAIKKQYNIVKILKSLKYIDPKRTERVRESLGFVKEAINGKGEDGSLRNAIDQVLSLLKTQYYIEDIYMGRFDDRFNKFIEEVNKYKGSIPNCVSTQMSIYLIGLIDKVVNDLTIYRSDIKSIYTKSVSDLDISSMYDTEEIWPSYPHISINQPEGTLESQFLLQVKRYLSNINLNTSSEELHDQLLIIDKFEKILLQLKEYKHAQDVDELLSKIHERLSVIASNILSRLREDVSDAQ